MPKALDANVVSQMDATGKRPCLLFELGLSSTIRYAAYMANVTFPTGGNVYTAKAIQVEGISQSLEGQIGRIVVKFDNVSKDMASYANTQDFRGCSLVIKRIYLDAVGDSAYYNEVFNGYMERPTEISRYWLTVPAVSGKPLNRKALTFPYQRLCPLPFGGTLCNTDSLADLTSLTASGTADSGSTTTLVDNALTQVDDYWNFGKIKITKSSVDYWRVVKDFDAGTDTVTLDVALTFSVDTDCTYVIYKGCDKSWDCCGANSNYGPSGDNTANFGGCLHIDKPQDQNAGTYPVGTVLYPNAADSITYVG